MRLRIGAVAVAFAAVLVDAATGGHYGTFAAGMVVGGVNVWWWSR